MEVSLLNVSLKVCFFLRLWEWCFYVSVSSSSSSIIIIIIVVIIITIIVVIIINIVEADCYFFYCYYCLDDCVCVAAERKPDVGEHEAGNAGVGTVLHSAEGLGQVHTSSVWSGLVVLSCLVWLLSVLSDCFLLHTVRERQTVC